MRFDTITTMVEGKTNSVFDQALEAGIGHITDPVEYNKGYIVLYNDGVEPARLKTFEEARAELVTANQTILEAALLRRLRVLYDATTYEDHLRSAYEAGLLQTPTDN